MRKSNIFPGGDLGHSLHTPRQADVTGRGRASGGARGGRHGAGPSATPGGPGPLWSWSPRPRPARLSSDAGLLPATRPPALGLPTTRSRTGSRSRIPLRPRGLRRPAVWVGKAPLRLEVSLCGPLLPPRGPSPLRDSQPLGGRVSTRPDWTRGARAPSRAFCRAGRDASPGLREDGGGSGSVPPTVAGVTRLRCPAGAGRPFRPPEGSQLMSPRPDPRPCGLCPEMQRFKMGYFIPKINTKGSQVCSLDT